MIQYKMPNGKRGNVDRTRVICSILFATLSKNSKLDTFHLLWRSLRLSVVLLFCDECEILEYKKTRCGK